MRKKSPNPVRRIRSDGIPWRILVVERTRIDGCFRRQRTFDARAILDHEA